MDKIALSHDSAEAFSPEQMASDITALKDGEGAAVYNLGNGKMAVVTKRKGDGTISVGLIENKNTNAVKATHGVKSIEGAVSLVKSMQDGTYGQPKASAPKKGESILKEKFEITEKNVDMTNAPKVAEAPKAAKKAEAKKVEPKSEKKKAPENEATSKTESEKKYSEQKKQAPATPSEDLSTVEDRLRGKKYAGTTFTAKEINAARADFKMFDALSPKVRSDILIMRRSAKEAKIDAQKVKGLTRLMAAYKFSATFSSEIKSNGFWRHGKNLLVVNPNDIYQSTFGHELSHRVEDYKGYDAFASAVESLVGKARLDAEMKQYLADYNASAEQNGWEKWDAEKNAADLKREAVASIVGKYLSNAEYIDKLARADRGFVYRIYRTIKGMKNDIALANQISTEAETSKLTEYRTIRRMEKVFEGALGLTEKETNRDYISYYYIGDTKDNRRCYVSGFDSSVSMDERIKLFKQRIATVFNLGAVVLKTDTKKIQILGDKFTSKENIYGDKKGADIEKEAKVNALYDMADILATAKYDGNATQTEPSYANPAIKPKNAAHKNVKYWYKFRNEIVFDGVPFTVTFNIRDKGKEQYQYLIDFKENKTPGLSTTAVKGLLQADQASHAISIPDSVEKINPSDENSEKISRSVSSRIVFGTPANTVGVRERAKGVIEKVKGIVTDKAERKAALEKLREAADHFSVLASNSFAAVETQLRRMGDGTYQRITRQAAQEKVQLIRVAALEKSVGALNSFCIRVITCR